MAGTKRRKSIPILGGSATLNPPSPSRKTWTINYRDHDGKPRSTSGGTSRETAELKARAKLGWSLPNDKQQGAQAPTLQDAYDHWITKNSERWNPRTIDNYKYCGKRFLESLGQRRLNTLSPTDIASIDLEHLSREQAKKTRSLIRGVLTDNSQWILHDVERMAKAVNVKGTAAANRKEAVSRGDIPSAEFVNSTIMCAYSTLQDSPIGNTTDTPPEWMTEPHHYTNGLPEHIIDQHRRGIPKHYSNVEQRRADETKELASIFRRLALVTALGAGGGLRIGEVLALRVRHLLPIEALPIAVLSLSKDLADDEPLWINYQGKTRIMEQASQAARGKIWLTSPKGTNGGKERTVHLPALLPAGYGNQFMHGHSTTREQVGKTFPKFLNRDVSLWELSRTESKTLWAQGYPPLTLILWDRLSELWNSDVVQRQTNERKKFETFSSLLLFPTRNPARTGRDGLPNVQFERGWSHDSKIVEGTGTYISSTNFAGRYTSPLYDYVSEHMGSYPAHRINSNKRKGWTHHGLRHYAITSWLNSAANIPLTVVAEQAGHEDIGFTLRRYAHIIGDNKQPSTGFEI